MKMKWLSVLTALLCFAATATGQGRGFMYSVSTEIGKQFPKEYGIQPHRCRFHAGLCVRRTVLRRSPPHPSPTSCSAQTAYRTTRTTSGWVSAPDTTSCQVTARSYPSAPLSEEASTPIPPVALLRPVCKMGHFRLLQTARRTRSTLLPVARQHRQGPSLPLRQHRVPLQLTSPRTFAAGCRFVTAPCLP